MDDDVELRLSDTGRGWELRANEHQGGRSSRQLDQSTGLGDGGHKPSTLAGKYSFVVKTTCGWNVSVAPTPTPDVAPVKPAVTTTTLHLKSAPTPTTTPPVKSSTSKK
ncbi:MAG: hypothetical protein ABSC90_01750 [Acidimicrobiales bacterium]|jgi:hypothetical protein